MLSAWLSKKINSPRLAAVPGLVLIGVGINGLVSEDMPTIPAILIIVVGVIDVLRLLPQPDEQVAVADEIGRPRSTPRLSAAGRAHLLRPAPIANRKRAPRFRSRSYR